MKLDFRIINMPYYRMISTILNRPVNPFRDASKPTYLTVGDVIGATVLTLAIVGSIYSALEYGDNAVNWLDKTFTETMDEPQGALKSQVQTLKVG